ncbi:ATP-dependent DNA helicase [Aliarcobacter cryaerophilus]|uniref:ATP-dependent DNA helicase n=1 Tax=Aliarcobacter cryaerophilus TaxID=28198 RepID=UPI0021B68A19|nr:AAA family ATPase [Aliarcobacter cryaerophilus]MCT7519193.1 AAA family ATPase [Aliarcobacter cryaerophilus]
MKNDIQIVKRLESIKISLELGDLDIVKYQALKLEDYSNTELQKISDLLKSDMLDIDQIINLINSYLYKPKVDRLTQHQQEIFEKIIGEFKTILDNKSKEISSKTNFVSLSGSAGVGKTFVSSKLIEYFVKKMEYKILLTAPTHKSLAVAKSMLNSINLNIPTKTVQSYLDIKLFTDYIKGTKKFVRDKIDLQADYEKDLDILVVDESSMISNELLMFIEENLEQNKLKSVLFIGDPYQLPPVDEQPNAVRHLPKTFELTEIVRQAKDSYIKTIANELKDCIKHKKFIPIMEIFDINKYPKMEFFYELEDMYDDFVTPDKWYRDNIVLSYTNRNVDEYNRELRKRYWLQNDIYPTEPIIEGELLVFNESYKTEIYNSEVLKVIKVERKEDKFVILKDDSDNSTEPLKYFNCLSSDGRNFKTVDPDYYKLFSIYLGNLSLEAKTEKEKEKRKALWKRFFILKEEYADLKYIHASTIHKSQGSTYKNVYLDLGTLIKLSHEEKELAYRLMYVAVTRASENIKIIF